MYSTRDSRWKKGDPCVATMLSSKSLMAHINSCALALPWKGLEGPAETPGPSSLLPLLPRPLMARYVCFLVPGACAKIATERIVVSMKTN